MKREPLCSLAYCPDPSNPDWHVCLMTGSRTIEHHHVKGRIGKVRNNSRWVVPLAHHVHENISLHTWTDGVIDDPRLGPVRYWIVNERGVTLLDTAPYWMQEDAHVPSRPRHTAQVDRPVAVGLVSALLPGRGVGAQPDDGGDVRGGSLATQELTWEAWCEEIRQLARSHRLMAWIVGDALVYGDDHWGDDIYQVVDELGYTHETLSNMMSVCRAFPASSRDERVPFNVARLLAPTVRAGRDAAEVMAMAGDEGMTMRKARALGKFWERVSETCVCDKCGKEHQKA